MPTTRSSAWLIHYLHYLVVVGGVDHEGKNATNVEILDTSRSQWYNAEPLRRASIPGTFITFSFLLSFYFNSRLHSYF